MALTRQVVMQGPQRMCHRPSGVMGTSTDLRRFLSSSETEQDKSADKKKKEEEEETAGSVGGEEKTSEENVESTDTETQKSPPPVSKEEMLEAQVKELKDQVLRSYAEQENTRKIAARDVDSARQFAIKSFAKSLLEVSDNLTLAMEAVPEEMRTGDNIDDHAVLKTLYEGIDMTERGLLKAFETNGLERYGKVGEPFDPNKHDALYEYADPEKEPGTVGQVMKSGFLLHKRVLRPAEVGVVKAS